MELPFEIFYDILSHLDQETLRTFLLVNEDFQQLIIKTPKLMRNLPVIFYGENWRGKIKFVKEFGDHVRSVRFSECKFRDVKEIGETLKFTPNIEKFGIENCKIISTEGGDESDDSSNQKEEINTLSLKNLRKFSIRQISTSKFPNLMKIFEQCETLESFKLRYGNSSDDAFFQSITNFIAKQKNLRTLELIISNTELFFNNSWANMTNLKIKTLSLQCELPYNRHLSNFLLSQSESLESLDLYDSNMDFHYLRLILRNLFALKKLKFSGSNMLGSSRIQEIQDIRMNNLTELSLKNFFYQFSAFKTLIQIFPNIENLNISCQGYSIFDTFCNLKKLRKLSISRLRLEMIIHDSSENVTELVLEELFSVLYKPLWEKFAANYPNVEKLTIKAMTSNCINKDHDVSIGILLEILKLFKNLKYFELHNPYDGAIYIVRDSDDPEREVFGETNMKCRMILEKTGGKSFKLKVSQYFLEKQQDQILKLKEDFQIVEIEENIDV